MQMPPTDFTALVQRNVSGTPTLAKGTLPIPTLQPNQLLIKVSHVAQNPTDVQSFDSNAFGAGSVFGCDFVGSVEELGSEITTARAVGDVVAGLIWGGEIKGLGAYAEYTVADEKICFKLPASVKWEEAASLPLAVGTAVLALFSGGSLGIPKDQGGSVLVWGGSSSVGLYAIQIAKLYGLTVITTCSPSNFDLVRSVGADHVFNYRDTDVVDQIRKVAPGLQYVFDTIGRADSSATASKAVRDQGGKLCTVRPGKANTEDVEKRVEVSDVLVWTAFLKEHRYGEFYWPPNKEDHELVARFFADMPKLLDSGKIKPNRVSVKKGLDAVEEGFREHREGKISGYKIVYAC